MLIMYPWPWCCFDRFFVSHFLHSRIIFLLIICHKHFKRPSCVKRKILLVLLFLISHENDRNKTKLKLSLFILVVRHMFVVVRFKGIKALSWSQKRCISTQHLKWAFTGRSYVIQGQLPTSMIFLWFKIHKGHVCYIHEMCEFVSTYLHILLDWVIILKVPNVECKLLFMQNLKFSSSSLDKNLIMRNRIFWYLL